MKKKPVKDWRKKEKEKDLVKVIYEDILNLPILLHGDGHECIDTCDIHKYFQRLRRIINGLK